MTAISADREIRHAYSMFPSGVAAVCALDGEAPLGMAMSSFTSVSLDPPLVSVCAGRGSTTWPRLAKLPWLGVSILGAGHSAVCAALAAKEGNRFRDTSWHATERGAVLIDGSVLWMECGVHDQVDAGDHRLILLEIADFWPHPERTPLVFHRSVLRSLPDELA